MRTAQRRLEDVISSEAKKRVAAGPGGAAPYLKSTSRS